MNEEREQEYVDKIQIHEELYIVLPGELKILVFILCGILTAIGVELCRVAKALERITP